MIIEYGNVYLLKSLDIMKLQETNFIIIKKCIPQFFILFMYEDNVI